jgi:acid phosphatase type 7
MFSVSRRAFLGASLAGLATGRLLADDPPAAAEKAAEDAAFQPGTLFLTWQRDPTTTMTVQWVGTSGETADTTIS